MATNWKKITLLFSILALAAFIHIFYPAALGSPFNANQPSGGAWNNASSTQSTTATNSQPSISDPSTINSNSTNQVVTSSTDPLFMQVGTQLPPAINEEGSVVADVTNGTIFEGQNIDARWPTASLTKLISATIIFDHLSMDTKITISPEMFAVDPTEGTLVIGGTYTVSDLLHVMLMPSSNVAVESMADFYGHAQFMQEVNTRAKAWGMEDSYFDDPSGLSAANESTPHDLLILAQHVYEDYPQLLSFTNTPSIEITELNSGRKVTVRSINNFAGTPGFVGGKTGHTPEAQGNLLSIFSYNDHPVLIVVLGTADRFADSTKLLKWFKLNYK